MSISGLGTSYSSAYYYAAVTKSRSGSLSNCPDSYAGLEISKNDPMYELKQEAKNAVTNSPYCKCIIANIRTEELYATKTDSGEMIYSYQKTEQRFQIFINSDGRNKTYSVKGFDKDGKPFEKELNPEDIDPEYADFTEFSALCMYFEQTEETVNFLSNDYFDTDDILEKIDYFEKLHRLTADELREDKDWREMSDDEWDKMLEKIDKFIDDFKERIRQLKEMQEEAAQKAAMGASPDMKATAASSAALNVATGGSVDAGVSEENTLKDEHLEKNWTKILKTDDQTILRTAQAAQDMEKMAMSKLQEVQLTDSTKPGVSRVENVTECASVEEDENKEKIWTITAFGEDGIISTRCQNGKILDRWEIKYKNPDDAKRVQDFIDGFDKDANLIFAGSKEFWEEFLTNRISVEV